MESVIDHLKAERRMGCNHLTDRAGDAANALLAAIGYNLRLLLAWLAALLSTLRAPLSARRLARLNQIQARSAIFTHG